MPEVLARIPRGPEAEPALDARALFAQGLEHVRALARVEWTDHNAHDPGVTILELVAYALTDVAYRCELPIEDLVARAGASDAEIAEATAAQFRRPSAVLPTRPWTRDDWRRALIDLEDVANAWIEPVEDVVLFADLVRNELRRDRPAHDDWKPVAIRGLHRVRVELADDVGTPEERDAVLEAVRSAIRSQRNLCEEFVEVRTVKAEYFALCAEIELEPGADVTECAARLLFDIGRVIAPPIVSRPLPEVLPPGVTLPDLLEGPLLRNGTIDDGVLADTKLRDEIRLSDVIGVAMDVPGVRSVRDLVLSPLDRADEDDESAPDADPADVVAKARAVPNPWRVPVRRGRLPRLSAAQGRLVFVKRGMPVAGWAIASMPPAVRARFEALRAGARSEVETPTSYDRPLPRSRRRELGVWRSFQHDFPEVYGIGDAGLRGGSEDPDLRKARRAQALQLQGYLLFFDQWMADQVATLARAGRVLSVAPEDLREVAVGWKHRPSEQHVLDARIVDSVVDHAKVYASGVTPLQLAACLETTGEAAARRQRVLDHLLARVGEDFAEYAAVVASAFGTGTPESIADKCAFLESAAELARDRAAAYRQLPDGPDGTWDTDNVSGLERRVARLLGIADWSRRNLSAVAGDASTVVEALPGGGFRFRVVDDVLQVSVLSSDAPLDTEEAARAAMLQAIERGQSSDAYRLAESPDGHHRFEIVDLQGAVLARSGEDHASSAAASSASEEAIAYLRERYSGEGLYVVEHLLLRPRELDDPLLPICTDAGCVGCADVDPYSYRLRVVLPAYAGRFRNAAFRDFVEETIRRETPVHVLPTVCWIDVDDMRRFERAWREWLELQAEPERGGRAAKLQALVDALVGVKNVYPTRTLSDCSEDVRKSPFLLGRTSLGRGE